MLGHPCTLRRRISGAPFPQDEMKEEYSSQLENGPHYIVLYGIIMYSYI